MPENLDIQALFNDYVLPWGINIVFAILIFYVGRMVVNAVVGVWALTTVAAKNRDSETQRDPQDKCLE